MARAGTPEMAQEPRQGPMRRVVRKITETVLPVAVLSVASWTGYFVYHTWDFVRHADEQVDVKIDDLRAERDFEMAQIRQKLAPLKGESIRDSLTRAWQELEHARREGHKVTGQLETMSDQFHEEFRGFGDALLDMKARQALLEQRCELYREAAERGDR